MDARIAHIDDDESMREALAFGLESEGWVLFSYPYDRVNLADLEQIRPDLIILDFKASEVGKSWELLQLLKMDDSTAKIPVIISAVPTQLSAETSDYLFTHYIKVVTKPFDFDTLLPLIHKTLLEASQASIIFATDPTLAILLVDDQDDLRDDLATVLRMEGYRVVTAYNGQVALDTVSRADYCLIMLDIDMPVMNGYEFLAAYDRQLRPHSPVIIVSGESDVRLQDLPTFVVDVLQKPVRLKLLVNAASKYAHPVRE